MSENRILVCPVCGATLSSRAFPPPEDRVITADPLSIDRSGSAFYSDENQSDFAHAWNDGRLLPGEICKIRAPFDWAGVVLLSCLCGASAGAIGTMLYVCWRMA